MQSYWSAAQLEPNRTRLALHLLDLHGYETYCPRIRERRVSRGRAVEAPRELFVGYCFVLIVAGRWYTARWCPGVTRVVLAGERPAAVPDAVIAEIRARERDGLVELPKPPKLKRGDRVRIVSGAFDRHLALYEGQTAHERVAVLQFLGAQHRTKLPANAIEPVEVER
jgi:transcriptional antiterminator RfaH